MQLEGIYPIVPTPFEEDGKVDHASIEKLTTFMIGKGVNGIAVLGALGEGHKLDANERSQVVQRFKTGIPQGIGLVVGVRAAATDLAARMARTAQKEGADAILLGPLPVQSDPVLATYYERVSSAVDIPVIIHDYPAATGIFMSPDLISRSFRERSSASRRFAREIMPPKYPPSARWVTSDTCQPRGVRTSAY